MPGPVPTAAEGRAADAGRTRQEMNTRPDEKEDLPWERPDAVRRDCEPHRGPLVKMLGLMSFGLGFVTVSLCVPALLCLPLAVVVFRMAEHDLRQMEAGTMDPAGVADTKAGRRYAVQGVVLCLVGGLMSCALVFWWWFGARG